MLNGWLDLDWLYDTTPTTGQASVTRFLQPDEIKKRERKPRTIGFSTPKHAKKRK